MKALSLIAAGIILALAVFGLNGTQKFGGFAPTGGGTYRLKSSVGTSDTTINLSAFKEPVSNIPYTMSYLNSSIEYGTLDPQSSRAEFISFSGITQNSDGSAQLTGVTRGLTRTPAGSTCTASTTLAQSHAGQSIFILSNSPCFYTQYLTLNQAATSSAVVIFSSTTPPRYDVEPGATAFNNFPTTTLVDIAQLNRTALAGTVNATEGLNGVSQLATQIQMASSTSGGSSGANLVLQSKYATSSPGYAGLWTVITNNAGKIAQGFLDLTQNFTWTGMHTFTNLFATNASSTNATTTSFYIGTKKVSAPYFGGTGGDGTLSISSGTTTITIGSASVVEKNYTSISITGTGALNFNTNGATSSAGVQIILRSQGACTFTSPSNAVIDLRFLGGGPGTGHGGQTGGAAATGLGGGGGGGGSTKGNGSDSIQSAQSSAIGGAGGQAVPALATSSRLALPGGNGGKGGDSFGSGSAAGGAGGLGAAGLYIECAGGYTFTNGTILGTGAVGQNGSGSTGSGGGGGGAGGNVLVIAGSIISNTGTYTLTGGSGGSPGTSAMSGATGADGSYLVATNTYYY